MTSQPQFCNKSAETATILIESAKFLHTGSLWKSGKGIEFQPFQWSQSSFKTNFFYLTKRQDQRGYNNNIVKPSTPLLAFDLRAIIAAAEVSSVTAVRTLVQICIRLKDHSHWQGGGDGDGDDDGGGGGGHGCGGGYTGNCD